MWRFNIFYPLFWLIQIIILQMNQWNIHMQFNWFLGGYIIGMHNTQNTLWRNLNISERAPSFIIKYFIIEMKIYLYEAFFYYNKHLCASSQNVVINCQRGKRKLIIFFHLTILQWNYKVRLWIMCKKSYMCKWRRKKMYKWTMQVKKFP